MSSSIVHLLLFFSLLYLNFAMTVFFWFPLRFRLTSLFGGVAIVGTPASVHGPTLTHAHWDNTDWAWLFVFIFKAKKRQDVRSERRHVE